MSYNLLDIIVLLGSIQGFITAFILLFSKKYGAERSLGWIMLLLSLACLNLYLLNTLEDFSQVMVVLAYVVPLVIIMPVGPLLYQKTLISINHPSKLPRIHFQAIWIDLFPSGLAVGYFLGLWVGLFDGDHFASFDRFVMRYEKYADIPRWISVTTYSILSYRLIRASKSRHVRHAKKPVIGFLVFQLWWLVYLIPYLLPSLSNSLLAIFNWYPLYLPMVFLIYWLGINGLIDYKKAIAPLPEGEGTTDQILEKLTLIMEQEQLFLDPQLRLEKVVELTNLPQKTISSVLNQTLHKTFNEFVNEYRVNEVKAGLLDPAKSHLTITGIAFECGFNSQATFQRTFKELTGESPSAFRKRKLQEKTTQI